MKIEWPAKKETLGPFGWQSAEHFHRPRDARKEGEDLILELTRTVMSSLGHADAAPQSYRELLERSVGIKRGARGPRGAMGPHGGSVGRLTARAAGE